MVKVVIDIDADDLEYLIWVSRKSDKTLDEIINFYIECGIDYLWDEENNSEFKPTFKPTGDTYIWDVHKRMLVMLNDKA